MSDASGRARLTNAEKVVLASEAGFACTYCQVTFGSVVKRKGREEEVTRLEVDHVLPVAWTGRAVNEGNIVASCQICNGLKSDKVFTSIADARRHLDRLWVRKGCVVLFVPVRSNFEDPSGWAKEYARYARITGARVDAE